MGRGFTSTTQACSPSQTKSTPNSPIKPNSAARCKQIASASAMGGRVTLPHQANPRPPSDARPISCSVTPSTTAARPSPTAATEHGTPSMRSCSITPSGSSSPLHSRMPGRPRRAPACAASGGGRGPIRRGRSGDSGSRRRARGGERRGIAHAGEHRGRASEQLAPVRQPLDEVGPVLQAGAADHARCVGAGGGLHDLGHRARHAPGRAQRAQVDVAEAVDGDDVVPRPHRQLGEHARAHRDDEDRLGRRRPRLKACLPAARWTGRR